MQWDEKYRYKVIGTVVSGNNESYVVFNLEFAEKIEISLTREVSLKKAENFCFESETGFGITVNQHNANPLVSRFIEDVNTENNEAEVSE